MSVANIEVRYEGSYFCPHKAMTLGFSIGAASLVILVIVVVAVCVRLAFNKEKRKFIEEASKTPI